VDFGDPGDAGPEPFDPETFIRPTETKSLNKVYFIGPYGRRVSFASQQRRVLNTVWALEETSRIKKGDRVAVVGAGLAGVMAAVALAARGMRVFLYEEKPNALRVQSQTNHRYVHPTINFWPDEALRPSTRFPFFDWAAGVCDDIVKSVYDEWVELRAILEEDNRLQKFHNNTAVDALTPTPDGKVHVEARVKQRSGDFDAVVVTTGFGVEKILQNTQTVSYWQQDKVEDQVRDSALERLLVSGTGDGGLIDVLRLLHSDFDAGRFCLQIAHELAIAGAAEPLADLEARVKQRFVASYEATIAAAGEAAAQAALKSAMAVAADAYAEELDGYFEAWLPDGVEKLLDVSLIDDRGRQVQLVGTLPHPYSMNSAPIHRVLIAHALRRKTLAYVSGSLDAAGTGLAIETPAELQDVFPEYAIARHGSNLPIERFIPDEAERAALQALQEGASDWLRDDIVGAAYFRLDKYPPHDPTDDDFIISRLSRAEDYVKTFAGGNVSYTRKNGRRGLEVTPRPDKVLHRDKVPDELFGITLHVSDRRPRFSTGTRKR